MNMYKYQEATRRTAPTDTFEEQVKNYALGIAGESGEVTEIIKKNLFHGEELNKSRLVEELGDLLWYIARLADVYQIDLDLVAERNIQKLQERYENGFSKEASVNRKVAKG